MNSRLGLPCSGLLLCFGMAAGELCAQTATVTVRESAAGPPVAGAIVRLLKGDSVIAQGLTSESGRVTLRANGAGRFMIRVNRIGYAASPLSPVDLAAGETRTVELAVTSERIRLPEVAVQARTPCGKSAAERALAATLWEEIRQALTATKLSERGGLALRTRQVARTLSRAGVVLDERISQPRVTGSRPFVPLAPEVLAARGYVLAEPDSVVYNAPDADILLSDSFVESHCFGVTAAPTGDVIHIGLSFEPIRGHQIADIRGVLWVDRRSLELRRLEFQYVAQGNEIQITEASGHFTFDRLPSGAWYIRSWIIRMPRVERTMVASTYKDAVAGYREHGGSAEPLGIEAGAVAPAYFSGRVWDSLSGRGLAGVMVLVAGSSDTAVTDSLGRFEMTLAISGARQATFRHPLLALHPARGVRTVQLIPAARISVEIGTLGLEALVTTLCAADRGPVGLVGIILGRDSAMAGLPITATWVDAPGGSAVVNRNETTSTDPAGLWAFCDLPPRAAVRLRVGEGGRSTEHWARNIPDRGFRWLPLSVGRQVIRVRPKP